MSVNLTSYLDGVLLLVKAKPNSRSNQACGVFDGMLRISITATAEKGKANQAVIAVLAKTFSVPKAQIELIHGRTSANKTLLIRGKTVNELRDIINAG